MSGDKQGWTRRPVASCAADSAADGTLLDPASAYLAQLGPGSRRTMREALDKLADWASEGRCGPHDLPWHLLRLEHTAALRTRLCATLAPATANKHMAALRGVLRQCWRQGHMTAEDYQRVIDLPPIRGESPRRASTFRPEDFERIVRSCEADVSPAGARDEALLSLLHTSSLRRAEAVSLDLVDYDPAEGTIRVRTAIRGETRRLAVPSPTRLALDRWIQIRGREAGPLFNPVNKGGRIERRRLSEQAIYIACQKRASEAGLPPTSPEDLRRAYAGG
jgi:integrase